MQGSRTGINIYVFLLLACELLEMTIVSGFVLTLFRAIVFAMSFYFFAKILLHVHFTKILLHIKKEPPVIKALAAFYLLLAVYGIIVVFEGKTFEVLAGGGHKVVTLSYIVKVSWSILPIFAFYNYAKKGVLTQRYMLKWLISFAIVAVACYFFMLQSSQLKRDADEVTNNGGYLIVSLVPMFIFMETRSWQQYAFLAGAMVLIILSVKRGAILVGFMCSAVYFLYIFRHAKRSTRLSIILALVLGLCGTFFVFDKLSTSSAYFQERVDDTLEGDTSGRDDIQGFFLDYFFNEASITEQMIGSGANATLELYGMYAHNDWVELAINQGLIGLLLYLFFWIAFMKLLFKKNVSPEIKCCLTMLFVIYFLKTWFSMSYSEYNLYSSMTLGYCIAMSHRDDRTNVLN